MIPEAKFAARPAPSNPANSRAEEERARYDLLILPLVEALRETVTRIGAQMVLSVARRELREALEDAWHGCVESDVEISVLVRSTEAPLARSDCHHHLAEAARLIEGALTQYRKWIAFPSPAQTAAILLPLKAGWWHLQTVASHTRTISLVDPRHCCGCRGVAGQSS
jgi:hypothetical protein